LETGAQTLVFYWTCHAKFHRVILTLLPLSLDKVKILHCNLQSLRQNQKNLPKSPQTYSNLTSHSSVF